MGRPRGYANADLGTITLKKAVSESAGDLTPAAAVGAPEWAVAVASAQ